MAKSYKGFAKSSAMIEKLNKVVDRTKCPDSDGEGRPRFESTMTVKERIALVQAKKGFG